MKIEYNELPKNFKKLSYTKLEVYLQHKGAYPKDWNSTDELMLYTFLMQLQVISQYEYIDEETDLLELWRNNVMGCISNFWNKLDDDKKKSIGKYGSEDITLSPGYKSDKIHTEEQFCSLDLIACDGFNSLPSDIEIKLRKRREEIEAEKAEEQKILERATKIAKAQLEQEQEELEAEEEAEREANKIHIVRPIKGYYKHDQ